MIASLVFPMIRETSLSAVSSVLLMRPTAAVSSAGGSWPVQYGRMSAATTAVGLSAVAQWGNVGGLSVIKSRNQFQREMCRCQSVVVGLCYWRLGFLFFQKILHTPNVECSSYIKHHNHKITGATTICGAIFSRSKLRQWHDVPRADVPATRGKQYSVVTINISSWTLACALVVRLFWLQRMRFYL